VTGKERWLQYECYVKNNEKMDNITKHQGYSSQNHSENLPSHLSGWLASKKTGDTNDVEGVEKREHFCTVGEIVTWFSHCGKQYDKSSENKELPYNPAFPHMDIYPKKIKILT